MDWISCLVVLLSVWCTVVFELVQGIPHSIYNAVLVFPLVMIILFGLYSVLIITYRVITFNNCVEAAEELKDQIKQAKLDLTNQGMVFTDWFAEESFIIEYSLAKNIIIRWSSRVIKVMLLNPRNVLTYIPLCVRDLSMTLDWLTKLQLILGSILNVKRTIN